MPIATPEVYAQMLDRAKERSFAYPAINVTSSQTLNAALRGFADADSDGIVQVSTGGAEYLSGSAVKDMVTGSVALAEFARRTKVPLCSSELLASRWGFRDLLTQVPLGVVTCRVTAPAACRTPD